MLCFSQKNKWKFKKVKKIEWEKLKEQELPFNFQEQEKKIEQDLPYFGNPKNDNERLLNYQYAYKHGDVKALEKMYVLSKEIAGKYINQFSEKNKKIKMLSCDDREIKAHNATTYMIEQFIKRPNFIIKKSVTAYLWLRVEQELFYHRKVDSIIEFGDLRNLKIGWNDDNFSKDVIGGEEMKSYIAMNKKGKVKRFDTQKELKFYFNLDEKEFLTALIKGSGIIDPDTQEEFYIDEELTI